jgi:hypothetical protein
MKYVYIEIDKKFSLEKPNVPFMETWDCLVNILLL